MIKILIERELNAILQQNNSFLHRNDVHVVTASSPEEIIDIHRAERTKLIMTQSDLPGMSGPEFCSRIRQDADLRDVSIIMVCANNKSAKEKVLKSGADAVYRRPIKPEQVLAKTRKLLNISWRETYRVLLSVSVEGSACDTSFNCRTLDLSTSGMLMETARTFQPGDIVVCSFYLPDADTTHIQATGVVIRSIPQRPGATGHRYGINFLNLTPDAQRAVDAFLSASAAGPLHATTRQIEGSARGSRGSQGAGLPT